VIQISVADEEDAQVLDDGASGSPILAVRKNYYRQCGEQLVFMLKS
jgi:hypothetical protein